MHDGDELNSILGYPSKPLPIQYLGAPITGRAVKNTYCAYLVVDLQKFLFKWSNHALSYTGRIQLVQWLFLGKFNNLRQSSFIPAYTLGKIRSITYSFIWNKVAWSRLTLPIEEGGACLKDFGPTTAIHKRYNDSANWREILKQKDAIAKCMDCLIGEYVEQLYGKVWANPPHCEFFLRCSGIEGTTTIW